jgi:DNA-binding MarR family transcriptional regulator
MASARNVPVDEVREPAADGQASGRHDPLDVVEKATAQLTRNFEMLRRRSDIYSELDKAGYLLLRTLEEMGPTDIGSLAAAIGLDPSTAGRQVAVMQEKGLVDRAPDPADRRRSIISPTGEGHRRMVGTRCRRRGAMGELLSDWSDEDLSTLGRMLTRYNHAVAQRYLAAGD